MSYCRWSSDNFKSDIYCYADVSGGWTIHVASKHLEKELPPLLDFGSVTKEEWADALRKTADVPIGLEHDGETFRCYSIKDTIDKLVHLHQAGYHVPKHALERLREELGE
ncbi:MAG: hypothetical protein ABIG63_05160 [Chloroflexota bacterium]